MYLLFKIKCIYLRSAQQNINLFSLLKNIDNWHSFAICTCNLKSSYSLCKNDLQSVSI